MDKDHQLNIPIHILGSRFMHVVRPLEMGYQAQTHFPAQDKWNLMGNQNNKINCLSLFTFIIFCCWAPQCSSKQKWSISEDYINYVNK